MIPAHDSPLAALAFDASGTKLATASEKVSLPSPGGLAQSLQRAFQLVHTVEFPDAAPRGPAHRKAAEATARLSGCEMCCQGGFLT